MADRKLVAVPLPLHGNGFGMQQLRASGKITKVVSLFFSGGLRSTDLAFDV